MYGGAARQRAFVFHAKQVDIAVDVSPGRFARSRPTLYPQFRLLAIYFIEPPLPTRSTLKQFPASTHELAWQKSRKCHDLYLLPGKGKKNTSTQLYIENRYGKT